MQGSSWGWDAADPHCSDAASGHWQGQWESYGRGESSGWGAGSWDQLGDGGNTHYEEFENVMRWDDSGALEALEIAKKLNEDRSKGFTYSVSLPSPDLYIQAIDWNCHEDLKLPDPGGTFSPPPGERKEQRKRGRKASGGFRRQFERQETSHVADWKQNSKPFSQTASYTEVKAQPEQEHLNAGGPSSTQMLQGTSDPNRRAWSPSELQLPWQEHGRTNWPTRWSSPYQKQNFNGHDYGRSHLDGHPNPQYHPNQHTWRPTNVSSQQARGWGHEGVPPWSSHGFSNNAHFQATPIAHGNDWLRQHETNMQGFTHQPFSTGLRQQHAPIYAPDKTNKWRPQQQSNRRWH